jgi:hypothetical protein
VLERFVAGNKPFIGSAAETSDELRSGRMVFACCRCVVFVTNGTLGFCWVLIKNQDA